MGNLKDFRSNSENSAHRGNLKKRDGVKNRAAT